MRNDRERLIERDEVELIELFESIWQHKLLVICTTLIVLGGAMAYALLATPVYEVKAVVLPPAKSEIAVLNEGRGGESGLDLYTSKDVYEVYLRSLQSESLRREFFREDYLSSLSEKDREASQDALYERFNKMLTVSRVGKDAADRFSVRAATDAPSLSVQWVERYIEMAAVRARRILIADAMSDAAVLAGSLEQSINQSLATARKQREDEIARLTEALKVARSIGLELPPIITGSVADEVSAGMKGELTYMRGTKALEAEIVNLTGRSSDDPFVANLRQWQESRDFYRNIRIESAAVGVYQKDGVVEQPDSPVQPRKALIMLGGLLAGMILGVVLALIARFRAIRSTCTDAVS
ncbi:LPS O-antigen chain length determinant protein WzzB [Pseudomonas soli]|uniref:LPS O-antigen chain length determinant protein WzzB n=1 Tax=Pseudomonas soli TaxID=1306993 RepID=UPI003D088BF2